jgi:dTMP kinase
LLSSKEALEVALHLPHPYLQMPVQVQALQEGQMNQIYTFLRKNKVLLRALNYAPMDEDHPSPKRALVDMITHDSEKFARARSYALNLRKRITDVVRVMTSEGVDSIFIKSFHDFPLDSDNFDILVREKEISKARELLERSRFRELVKVREPFKWLYRRVDDGLPISIHLHTGLGWEGVKFVNEADVWEMSTETKLGGVRVGFPSREHHLLITAAHAFFENRRIKLSDIMYMAEALHDAGEIKWDYITDWCAKDHWLESFCIFLRLADCAHQNLYRESLVGKQARGILQDQHGTNDGWKLGRFKSEELPMDLPVTKVGILFFRKVLRTNEEPLPQRISKVASAAFSYVKRRMPLRTELPPVLVCFSGQDGTGKTVHAKRLQNDVMQLIHITNDQLIESKFRIKYVWSRGIGPSIEPLLGVARLLLLGRSSEEVGEYAYKRQMLLRREPMKTFWAFALILGELLEISIRVRPSLLMKRMVICDRYIYDTIVDVECGLGKSIGSNTKRIIERLAPTPQVTFVLDADTSELVKRKGFSDNRALECGKRSYKRWARESNGILIDTTREFRYNSGIIVSKVTHTMMLS